MAVIDDDVGEAGGNDYVLPDGLTIHLPRPYDKYFRGNMIQRRRQDNKLNWLAIGAAAFIGLALFPYGWLAERWWLFGQVTDFVFGTELAHVIGHLILFATLGTAVLYTLPHLQRHPRLYFMLIFGLGLAQEILQLVSFKKRPFAANEFLDITVDLLGAFIACQFFRTRIDTD